MKTTIRKEERYFIRNSKVKEFTKKIASFTYLKNFPNNYNQTLYFNNSEHEVPFEISIKARRYTYSPWKEHFRLDPEEKWIFEIKRDLVHQNSRMRQKERENLKLKEILETLQKRIENITITHPLRPYVADNYRRKHFIIKGGSKFRITLDDKLKYYLFDSRLGGGKIGRESFSRVEIKVPQNKLDSLEFYRIKELLQDLGADTIVSKKDTAYNLLSEYLRKKSKKKVKPSNTEIEAKLSLSREKQQIFRQIKNDFYNGNIDGFEILKAFPYILENGKLHRYLITPHNDCLRISMKGESKRIIYKGNSEIVNDSFRLNCIIKRSEVKAPFSLNLLRLPSKTIYRKRKYFIVENRINKNDYCILIDRCTFDSDELFQMEIEGILLSPSKDEEKEVIKNIAYITKQLIKKYRFLKPTTLTKLDWLKDL